MIGYIEGVVQHKDERTIIINVSGVGYLLSCNTQILISIEQGDQIALWTHLAVREDAMDLYGFRSRDELQFFKLLIGISGIGPKSALNILSLADLSTISHAIASGDASYLTKVSGIGKKFADKIILELKDKMSELNIQTGVPHSESEALDALEALGYLPRDTRDIVRVLAKEHERSEDIIRRALQILGGRS